MALKPFNSVGGYAVGETPINVIDSAGNITTLKIDAGSSNNLEITANSKTITLYANSLTDFPGNISADYFLGNFEGNISGNIVAAGVNYSILYNASGEVEGGNLLLWNYTSNILDVDGTIESTGNINANTANVNANNIIATKLVKGETLQSTITTGTSPFTVASTTLVSNLNADLLDGYDSSVSTAANTVVVRNADGNVAANFFIGNGSALTGIATAGNLANGNSNVTIPTANGNVNISVAGNANIAVVTGTGVNVAGYLNATGNGIFSNVYANSGTIGASLLTGTLTTSAQPNITSVGTLSSLTVTANVAAGNLTTGGALSVTGNANVGNLGTAQVLATANVTAPQLIANIANGTTPLLVNSQTKVANLNADLLDGYDTATSNTANTVAVRNADGNLTATYFIGNGSQLSGIDTSQIQNGTSNVRIATSGGNVTTSVGGTSNVLVVSSTGANITGTANVSGNANVGNLGTATAVITTGNITTINSGLLQNGNSNVTITNNSNIVFNAVGGERLRLAATSVNVAVTTNVNASMAVTQTLTVTGNITTSANLAVNGAGNSNITGNLGIGGLLVVTGNVSGGNITTGGVVAATGNVSGGNLTTAGALSVTGNANVGNIGGNNAVFTTLTGTLSTAAQPNVTSLGTLTSLDVTGNGTFGNVYANSGTIGALTLKGEGGNISNITGANVSGTVANATHASTANTVTTAAQPNITSVGTLSSLAVTGNASAGNISTGGTLSVTGNANVGNLGIAGVLTVSGTGVSTFAGNVDMTGNYIVGLATPINATDAATKQYVDNVAEGLHVHESVGAVTTDTLANISSGTITYNNGTAGVGATLTTDGTFTAIDGVTLTSGIRILVKNEANTAHNGIYTFTNSTTLTRATDFDTSAEIQGGDFLFATGGTLYDNTGWVQVETVTTVGTDPIVFTQFSGAGTYTAGTGLTLSGSEFSISNTTVTAASYGNGDRVASFTVNAQGQLTAASDVVIAANAANLTGTTLNSSIVTSSLTSVGTLGSLAVTGNGTFGNVYANSGTIGASLLTGTLTTSAQPNVTSVGTLSSLAVTANITAGNIYANSGTIGALTLTGEGGNISNIAGGNVTGQVANALVAGTVYTAAQPNITSVGTLSSLAVTGNGTFGNVYANSGTIGAANLTGTLTTASQPNITSVGTLTSLTSSGNVTAANLIVGNTSIRTAQVTTTTTGANQTIATFAYSGLAAVEYLVKGVDSTGQKYSIATVIAVTNGTTVDFVTFGTATLGGATGTLAVNLDGSNIALQVTPSSSNSTTWTTQIRVM